MQEKTVISPDTGERREKKTVEHACIDDSDECITDS